MGATELAAFLFFDRVVLQTLELQIFQPHPAAAVYAGRLAARAAGDALRSASDLLAEIQP